MKKTRLKPVEIKSDFSSDLSPDLASDFTPAMTTDGFRRIGFQKAESLFSVSSSESEFAWYSPESIVQRALLDPAKKFLLRPRKGFRAQLVQAGFQLSGISSEKPLTNTADKAACERLSEALEAIHAGSLIVDDIQDGSKERRGEAPLHEQLGTPLALNTGNWLYFQPFEWIRELGLEAEVELNLYRLCHSTMLQAHVGQALDLGTKIDEVPRESVDELCLQSLSLKTGALMALALGCGAALAKAEKNRAAALQSFGVRFGMALQMFDDLGNFQLPPEHPKRLEDLRLRRPTWLWSVAARSLTDRDYRGFVSAVRRLPDDKLLLRFVARQNLLLLAYTEAENFLASCFSELTRELGDLSDYKNGTNQLIEIADRIRTAYAPERAKRDD